MTLVEKCNKLRPSYKSMRDEWISNPRFPTATKSSISPSPLGREKKQEQIWEVQFEM